MNLASELGQYFGKNNIRLVHGAGKIGLMGALSRAVKYEGGYVTGVIPKLLYRAGIFSEIDDEMIVTETMHERKKIMHEKSDAFIALPGGFGTLEELLEIITLKQLRYHKKPIVILNHNNFYRHLLQQFEMMYTEKFSKGGYSSLYYVAENLNDVFTYLETYSYQITEDKWFR